MPLSCRASLTRSWAWGGMRLASRTPARSSWIGTLTLTRTGPSFCSSASTSTRRYLKEPGRGVPLPAPASGDSPSAAMSRSASSAVILPVESISNTWRRFCVMSFLLKELDSERCLRALDLDLGPGQRRQDGPNATQQSNEVDAVCAADHEQDRQRHDADRKKKWKEQQPHEEEWNRDPRGRSPSSGPPEPESGQKRNHRNPSSSAIAASGLSSPRPRRSRISVREGAGSRSTNSSDWEIRFNRDLMVG